MLDRVLSIDDFPISYNESPFEAFISRPEVFFDPIHCFSIKRQMDSLPSDAQTRIAGAYTTCYTDRTFRVIEQSFDSKYAYFSHIEIRTEKSLKIPFYCPVEGVYWLYQLRGQCLFDRQIIGNRVGLKEGEYKVTYSPPNKFTLRVEPGTHILFFFMVDTKWVLDSNWGHLLVRAMKEKRRGVFLTGALPIDNKIRQYLLELFTLEQGPGFSKDTKVLQPIGELIDITFRQLKDTKGDSTHTLETVASIRDYIKHQVGKGQIPAVSEMANHFGLSEVYLRQLHRTHFQGKLNGYIKAQKLVEARRMLEEEDQTVSAVAYKLGYQDLSTFSKQFKRHFGVPPSEMRPKKH